MYFRNDELGIHNEEQIPYAQQPLQQSQLTNYQDYPVSGYPTDTTCPLVQTCPLANGNINMPNYPGKTQYGMLPRQYYHGHHPYPYPYPYPHPYFYPYSPLYYPPYFNPYGYAPWLLGGLLLGSIF